MLATPATCGHDCDGLSVQFFPWLLANGANRDWKSTPEEAVESLETIVLLMTFTANASCRAMPAPSQPATLLAMMLLVMVTVFQRQPARFAVLQCPARGSLFEELAPCGKLRTSVPLMSCNRSPPP